MYDTGDDSMSCIRMTAETKAAGDFQSRTVEPVVHMDVSPVGARHGSATLNCVDRLFRKLGLHRWWASIDREVSCQAGGFSWLKPLKL